MCCRRAERARDRDGDGDGAVPCQGGQERTVAVQPQPPHRCTPGAAPPDSLTVCETGAERRSDVQWRGVAHFDVARRRAAQRTWPGQTGQPGLNRETDITYRAPFYCYCTVHMNRTAVRDIKLWSGISFSASRRTKLFAGSSNCGDDQRSKRLI